MCQMSSTQCSGLEVNHAAYRTDGKKLTWLRVLCMHPVRRTHNNAKKKERTANCAYRLPISFPPHQKFNATIQ